MRIVAGHRPAAPRAALNRRGERPEARLADPEKLAGAAQAEVLLGDPEAIAVLRTIDRRARADRSRRRVQEDAGGSGPAPADPPAQLVELGQTEGSACSITITSPAARRPPPRPPSSRPGRRRPGGEARITRSSSVRRSGRGPARRDRGSAPQAAKRSSASARPLALRGVDERAHPVGLLTRAERPAERGDHLVQAIERHRPRVDRRPAGRHSSSSRRRGRRRRSASGSAGMALPSLPGRRPRVPFRGASPAEARRTHAARR